MSRNTRRGRASVIVGERNMAQRVQIQAFPPATSKRSSMNSAHPTSSFGNASTNTMANYRTEAGRATSALPWYLRPCPTVARTWCNLLHEVEIGIRTSGQLPLALTAQQAAPGTLRFPLPAGANADRTGTIRYDPGFIAEGHCHPDIRFRGRVSQEVVPAIADVQHRHFRQKHDLDQLSRLRRIAVTGWSMESAAEIEPGHLHFRRAHE